MLGIWPTDLGFLLAANALKPKLLRRVLTKSEKFFSVYVNDAQITSTPWDLRIVVGEVGDTSIAEADPIANVTILGELRMSPQLAKKITMLMINQLQIYEKKFGEIPQPPDLPETED